MRPKGRGVALKKRKKDRRDSLPHTSKGCCRVCNAAHEGRSVKDEKLQFRKEGGGGERVFKGRGKGTVNVRNTN